MVTVREYRAADAPAVGILIADVYAKYNLDFATAGQQAELLGPFRNARSDRSEHRAELERTISAHWVLVAEYTRGAIVGVLRGKPGRLQSLFVREDCHRQGVGRALVERFQAECQALAVSSITLASSLYAVPFYLAMGYKRSTGVRTGWSFGGSGLEIQPVKKVL
jgi:GNAT superfamily N-acetyltransferase